MDYRFHELAGQEWQFSSRDEIQACRSGHPEARYIMIQDKGEDVGWNEKIIGYFIITKLYPLNGVCFIISLYRGEALCSIVFSPILHN